MFFVVQEDGNKKTLWGSFNSEDEVDNFCQYHIDSVYEGSADNFFVIGDIGKIPFYDYCSSKGIRRRTFDERMEDRRAPLYV